LKDRDWDTY